MKPMQDKEFDQFMKDQLAQAEVAPPAMLWAKVDAQLTPAPKKRFPLLWMAAALAVVAVSAGLLFNQQEGRVVLGQAELVTTAKKPVTETAPLAAAAETKALPTTAEDKFEVPFSPVGERETSMPSEVIATVVKNHGQKELIAMQPSGQEQHLVHSGNEVKQPQIEIIVVEDRELTSALTIAQEPVMVGIQETPQQDVLVDEFNVLPEKRGISNVGDLVNFVVDKIDKREEKFLQFNPNDEDQSSLVSINIGIIKLNTKQKAKR
jgi:hypothetical protein